MVSDDNGIIPDDLAQAGTIAITVVGEMAFTLGHDIGSSNHNEWTDRIRNIEAVPPGMWAGVFVAALEAVLQNQSRAAVEKAALDAAWRVVYDNSAGLAYVQSLYGRISSPAEGIATSLSIDAIGVVVSSIGFQLGRVASTQRPSDAAWKVAYDAAYLSALIEFSRHAPGLTSGSSLDRRVVELAMDEAVTSADRALGPYVRKLGIGPGRIVGAPRGEQGGTVASATGNSNGCVVALGIMFLGIMMLGMLALLGSVVGLYGEPDSTDLPAQPPPSQSTSPYLSVDRQDPVPRVGDCIGSGGYELVPCSTIGAKRINYVHLYSSNAPWPGPQFYTDARNYCPPSTTQFTHPEREHWQAGIKYLFCVE